MEHTSVTILAQEKTVDRLKYERFLEIVAPIPGILNLCSPNKFRNITKRVDLINYAGG